MATDIQTCAVHDPSSFAYQHWSVVVVRIVVVVVGGGGGVAAACAAAAMCVCCLLYTSPSPRDSLRSRMPSSA